MTRTTLNLGGGEKPASTFLHTYPTRSPIGGVSLDGGAIEVTATDASLLFRLADEFAKAAHDLRAALVEYEAQQIIDKPAPGAA
jgi:hypothetical protein